MSDVYDQDADHERVLPTDRIDQLTARCMQPAEPVTIDARHSLGNIRLLKPGIFTGFTDDEVVRIMESVPCATISRQTLQITPEAATPNWDLRCYSSKIESLFMTGEEGQDEVNLSVVRRSYEGTIVFGRETYELNRDSPIITITSHVNWNGNWPVGIAYTVIPAHARVVTHNIAVMNDPHNRCYPPGYDPPKSCWDNALAILLLALELQEIASRGDDKTASR